MTKSISHHNPSFTPASMPPSTSKPSSSNPSENASPSPSKNRNESGVLSRLGLRSASVSAEQSVPTAPPRSFKLPGDILGQVAARLEGTDVLSLAMVDKAHLAALEPEVGAHRLTAHVKSTEPASLEGVQRILNEAVALGPMFAAPVIRVLGERLSATPDVERDAVYDAFSRTIASLPKEHRTHAEQALPAAASTQYAVHLNAFKAVGAVRNGASAAEAAAQFKITDPAVRARLDEAEATRSTTPTAVTIARDYGRAEAAQTGHLFKRMGSAHGADIQGATDENIEILAQALASRQLKQPTTPGSLAEARLLAYDNVKKAQIAFVNKSQKDPDEAMRSYMPRFLEANLALFPISE